MTAEGQLLTGAAGEERSLVLRFAEVACAFGG
jgi:hypothetical protein